MRAGFDALRPFAWGFSELQIAAEPLENFTLRLDRCDLRLKDGTWVRVPENTEVEPLNFKKAMEASANVDVFLGIPHMQDVRANSVSLEDPTQTTGSPRYEPHPVTRRDENTGTNPQTIYIRKMRARLFVAGEDMGGYEIVRVGRVRRTDRPGALPELDDLACGPVLAVQASHGLSAMITALADQVQAKDDNMAEEAAQHNMEFTDGVANNMEHLIKLHVLNESRAHLRALLQCPLLHPYDVFVLFARLMGHLSIFNPEGRAPIALPAYDHDHPGEALDQLRARIEYLLQVIAGRDYAMRAFSHKVDKLGHDGLEIELERKWIEENLEMFLGLTDPTRDAAELERYIKTTFNLKLASPSQAPDIHLKAVRGLGWTAKAPPAGTLPRRQGLHYYRIEKTVGADRIDYWAGAEKERAIRMSPPPKDVVKVEDFKPTLFVILRGR